MHIRANSCQVFEEHTSRKLRRLIIQTVDRKANAGALVVVSVSLVEPNQISLVQLVLELSPEVHHQAVFRSGLDCSSVGRGGIRKLQSLHSGGVLDELVHET